MEGARVEDEDAKCMRIEGKARTEKIITGVWFGAHIHPKSIATSWHEQIIIFAEV